MVFDRPLNVRLFVKLMHDYQRTLQKRLNRFGIYRGQHFVLFLLASHPGLTQIEMAQKIAVSKSAIGVTVAKLESRGLILRVQDSSDARCNRLYMTDEGLRIAEKCRCEVEHVQNALFSRFDKQEEKNVEDVLTRMLMGIEELERTTNEQDKT